MAYRNALTQQFIRDRVRVDDAGCWIWLMSLDRHGYALLGPGATERLAHRLAYRLFIGSIPSGMTVDHICFVTNCLNPEHLQLLTVAENTRRQPTKVPGKPKVIPTSSKRPTHRTECVNGHEWVHPNIRTRGRRTICIVCERLRWHARRLKAAS